MPDWKQALYITNNPQKYMGDPTKLIYKSSWELRAFEMCDNNPNIVKWGYEIIKISYMKPKVSKANKPILVPSNYYPDLYVEYFDINKNFIREVIEIKPLKQTKKSTAKKTLTKMVENYTLAVNEAKWSAARRWCASMGIKFSILTENSLLTKKKP